MDNLFQLIIFLVIIYSVFNVIFGKKKPQNPDTNIPRKPQERDQKESSSASSPTDLLEEMFGLKIPKTDNSYRAPKESSETKWIPPVIKTDVPNETSSEDSVPVLMKDNEVNLSEPAHVQKIINLTSERTIEIKNRIRRPSSLKELYLISEILNKPKSFRK